jgi:glycosyltransferase involved in cell wall biosynthesis
MPASPLPSPVKIAVMLPRYLDVAAWTQKFHRGEVPDFTPYGYHFAQHFGCEVRYSRPTRNWSGLAGWLDKLVKYLLGGDIRHVWANRDLLDARRTDCVWTHTEYEHLAIAWLRKLGAAVRAPIISQSIWLIDEWPGYTALRQCILRWLSREAAVLTFHSPLNTQRAQDLRLGLGAELLEFGISLDSFPVQVRNRPKGTSGPIRVLAMGNDRHRDWATLIQALGADARFELHIGSVTVPLHSVRANMQVGAMTQAQLRAEYDWADCLVIPSQHNLHASGLTSILEGIAMGVPVVTARTGGLEHYFDAACVCYYDVGDAQSLRSAVDALLSNPEAMALQTGAAQQRLSQGGFSSLGFAKRHVQLTQRLLNRLQVLPE